MANKKKDREWLDSLKEMYKLHDYSKVYPELIEYVNKYPNDDYGKFLLGNVYLRQEQYDEAEKTLETIIDCKSKIKYQVYLLLANVYSNQKKNKLSYEMIDRFLEGPYRDVNQMVILSKTYINLKDSKKALETVNSISKEKEKNIGLNLSVDLADIYSKLGLIDKSEAILDRIVFGNKSNRLILQMSSIKERNEKYSEALGLIHYVIDTIDSTDINYFNVKIKECELLIKRHELDTAINNCYKLLLDNKADKDLVYLTLGDAYLEKNSYQEAKESYETVLKSESNDNRVEALYKLAHLSDISNHLDDALLYDDILIEEKTKYKTEALFNKVFINIRKEEYEEAYSILKKVKNVITNDEYMGYRIALVYLNKVLGLEQEELDNYSYTEKQIMDYSDELCLHHVIDHRKISGAFSNNINVEDLIINTKEKLTKDNICHGDFFDIYEIDYKNIGDNKDRYRVVAIPNTKDIITMYTIKNDEYKYHKECMFTAEEHRKNKEVAEKREKLYSKFYKH